jgi:hypothetical protein
MHILLRRILLSPALLSLILVATAQADYLGGITFSQPVPSYLPSVQYVYVHVDYKVDEAGGGRIFILPFTNGGPTPGYAVSGGPLVGPGTGFVSLFLRVTAGTQVVDQVRVRLTSPDQSAVWLEVFVPAYFAYASNGVFDVTPDRGEGSALRHGQAIHVDFDYASSDPAGCRIWVRPYNDGDLVPGYHASGSGDLPQSGSSSQWFYFDDDADVTQLHFTIANHDGTVVLREFDLPYDLHWRSIGVYDISFDQEYESSLHNTQNITATFTLDNTDAAGARVWAWCTTDDVFTPGCFYQGSGLEPVGAHVVSRYCRINTGEQDVDAIHIRSTAGALTTDFSIPVRLHWGPHAIQHQVFTPASPAVLSNNEHLNMTFDYVTDASAGVRIFVRPALAYELLFGISNPSSPLYTPPSGSGSFWLTFAAGQHVADSMRFQMLNSDQSVQYLNYFKHGHWAWGSPSIITPAPDTTVLAASQLGAVRPNPFNPVATIPLDLAADAVVRVGVYDVRGRLVRVLADGPLTAGRHEFRFDGADLVSGTYLCRFEGPGGVQTQRMTLVR